jgi:hypothetical protein
MTRAPLAARNLRLEAGPGQDLHNWCVQREPESDVVYLAGDASNLLPRDEHAPPEAADTDPVRVNDGTLRNASQVPVKLPAPITKRATLKGLFLARESSATKTATETSRNTAIAAVNTTI